MVIISNIVKPVSIGYNTGMVEHLFGNMWALEEGEYLQGTECESIIEGPVTVRIHDHTQDLGLIDVQTEKKRVQVAASSIEEFPNLVRKYE